MIGLPPAPLASWCGCGIGVGVGVGVGDGYGVGSASGYRVRHLHGHHGLHHLLSEAVGAAADGAHEHVRLEVLDDRLGRGSIVSPVGKA